MAHHALQSPSHGTRSIIEFPVVPCSPLVALPHQSNLLTVLSAVNESTLQRLTVTPPCRSSYVTSMYSSRIFRLRESLERFTYKPRKALSLSRTRASLINFSLPLSLFSILYLSLSLSVFSILCCVYKAHANAVVKRTVHKMYKLRCRFFHPVLSPFALSAPLCFLALPFFLFRFLSPNASTVYMDTYK